MGGGFIEFLFSDGQSAGDRVTRSRLTINAARCCRRWIRSS